MSWEIPKKISLLAVAILFLFTFFTFILDAPRTVCLNPTLLNPTLQGYTSPHLHCYDYPDSGIPKKICDTIPFLDGPVFCTSTRDPDLRWRGRSEEQGQTYTVKNVNDFPFPSQEVTNQTLPGRELLNSSRPGRVWLMTSRLGTGKTIIFFYSVDCSGTTSTRTVYKDAWMQT